MKKATENIVVTLTGKKVLFLENGTGLEECSNEFKKLLDARRIENKILEDIAEIDFNIVLDEINKADAIAFETQWVYDISKKLFDFMLKSKDKKIVIECYVNEPTWSRKPKSVHDVFIFTCDPVSIELGGGTPYEFYKLSNKGYWDYKNGFNR